MNLLRIYNTRLLSNHRNELDLKFNNEKKKRKNLIETASYVSPIES